ncbi:hypothetical protein EXIGLDRAFT_697707 [Exidia glandulosa HHB12029]|uniref:Uncharacterized protein n=1 Tax=Exidia glandulosa HHB12029 TaxID=1314781 RepID=A0A165MVP6_EXIGL|nr:hypothetical protein EXIGLDRAFT_697707 [Exidia glandulosa HHB12029]
MFMQAIPFHLSLSSALPSCITSPSRISRRRVHIQESILGRGSIYPVLSTARLLLWPSSHIRRAGSGPVLERPCRECETRVPRQQPVSNELDPGHNLVAVVISPRHAEVDEALARWPSLFRRAPAVVLLEMIAAMCARRGPDANWNRAAAMQLGSARWGLERTRKHCVRIWAFIGNRVTYAMHRSARARASGSSSIEGCCTQPRCWSHWRIRAHAHALPPGEHQRLPGTRSRRGCDRRFLGSRKRQEAGVVVCVLAMFTSIDIGREVRSWRKVPALWISGVWAHALRVRAVEWEELVREVGVAVDVQTRERDQVTVDALCVRLNQVPQAVAGAQLKRLVIAPELYEDLPFLGREDILIRSMSVCRTRRTCAGGGRTPTAIRCLVMFAAGGVLL